VVKQHGQDRPWTGGGGLDDIGRLSSRREHVRPDAIDDRCLCYKLKRT